MFNDDEFRQSDDGGIKIEKKLLKIVVSIVPCTDQQLLKSIKNGIQSKERVNNVK